MLENDNDLIRGLGFVTLYSAYLEEQIDNLLSMLSVLNEFTNQERRWPISSKIKKAKLILSQIEFEGRSDLITNLTTACNAFEHRNELVHGRIYANFDRPDELRSGRTNIPDRQVESAELFDLANDFSSLRVEIIRPMLIKIPKCLAGNS